VQNNLNLYLFKYTSFLNLVYIWSLFWSCLNTCIHGNWNASFLSSITGS